jgi:hypothetical protein
LENRRQNILFDLPAYASERDNVLNPTTLRQAQQLSPNASADAIKTLLYFTANDLWKGFWTRGDRALLTMASDFALFVHSHNVALVEKHEEIDRQELSNSLHLWMGTQFARKIQTCTLPDLAAEAAQLCQILLIRRQELWIRRAIIEACAGECKALDNEKDSEARERFIKENWSDLCEIHKEYLRKAAVGRGAHQDDEVAWKYLSEFAPKRGRPSPESIRDDPDFQRVINRGATEDVYQFAVSRNDEIQRSLERRLDIRLGLEHVIEPEGIIYDTANRKGTLLPAFAEARKALHDDEFSRAATLFENLSRRLQGKFQKIAKDYQAYSLARQGLQMPAQLPLEDVCDDSGASRDHFTFSSAYWNLACCMLSQDMDQQLEVLVRGLKAAPDPLLLRGAVYLGLFLNDPRLLEWLPRLTLTEALLLYYKLDTERGVASGTELTGQQKRDHVLRLAHYVLNGEPLVPDLSKDRIPDAEIQAYLNTLLDRNQAVAFEFWLACRELTSNSLFTHWEVKAEFLERTNRKLEAARAFQEELRARFRYLDLLSQKGDRRRFDVLGDTRKRLEKWLPLCMTPELKPIGFALYTMGQQFEKQNEPAWVLPKSPRVRSFYNPEQQQITPQAVNLSVIDMGQLLSKVSLESQARFRELSELPSIRPRFNDLLDGLRQLGHRSSGELFQRLLQLWEGYNRLSNDSERQSSLKSAQATLKELQRELERELNSEMLWGATPPLFASLKRVNDSLARDAAWLPRLVAEPVDGEVVYLDTAHEGASFPLRIRSTAGSPVRLKAVSAILEDATTELQLQDRLDDLDVRVGSNESAIVTLRLPRNTRLERDAYVNVVLRFEFSGGDYNTDPIPIHLKHQSCPMLPESPYISGRPLAPEEIEGHFFGRSDEQEKLLAAVRDGQQSLRYVEGIRRAGKSSLLNSLDYEIHKRHLPLIPIVFPAAAQGLDHAGKLLHNLLTSISALPELANTDIEWPSEQRCCENMVAAYTQINKQLLDKLPDRRILILLDDFNQLLGAAVEAREHTPLFTSSIIGLLNIIWNAANPKARLLWIFTGHKTLQQCKKDLSGADIWGTLRPLPIDFLPPDAVSEILTAPLRSTNVTILPETVAMVHRHTAGHPELVQRIGELMLQQAREEQRWILTPSDAHEAARYLALFSDDPFTNAWYPEAELKQEPEKLRLLVDFVRKVPVGQTIELSQLVAPNPVSEKHRAALDDLVARRILHRFDGQVGVRAYVFDLWLHRMVKELQADEPGAPAIFVDVANLTAGRGSDTLTNLQTASGDGVPGRFALRTVLKVIEDHVYRISQVPIAAKWAVNYPPRCPAVVECSAKDYKIANIPEELQRKAAQRGRGTDDHVLQETVNDVEQQYPNVRHFFFILGDIDYGVKVRKLLEKGKCVHIISRASALGNPDTKFSYDNLARKYPGYFTVSRLEELLERADTMATTPKQ